MAAVPSAVPQAVPSAVAPSPSTSVAVDTTPQLGPFRATTGTSAVPSVPVSDPQDDIRAQPGYGEAASSGSAAESGGSGAPSVPALGGVLFRQQPIDAHYQVMDEGGRDPYLKVNNPPTRGMVTWVKSFANHVFNGKQNVDQAGWQQSSPQQRTSWMRITPPALGNGYDPETAAPHQLPQSARTQKFLPVTGNDPYGSGVLNRDTFGAGQTAGGQGGNQYTPSPGPPDTTSTAGGQSAGPSMPTWG
jgi:hypothetical protein